ncbi:MAG: hypothetical protein CFE33_04870 [Pseudorhodobacter sp. PARRP1]|nr:MAG: hypothetical protein CFE33_04870 [Pseudorhodobacter sp. PARRP1]
MDIIATGGGGSLEFGTLIVMGLKKPISEATLLKSEPDLEISGRSLHRFSTTITVQYPPPVPEVNGVGMVYFDQPTGVMFTGERQMEWPPSDAKMPHSPAAIILPGEPGFDQPHPTYDCGNLSYNHLDKKADKA